MEGNSAIRNEASGHSATALSSVMPGLDPGIHALVSTDMKGHS